MIPIIHIIKKKQFIHHEQSLVVQSLPYSIEN